MGFVDGFAGGLPSVGEDDGGQVEAFDAVENGGKFAGGVGGGVEPGGPGVGGGGAAEDFAEGFDGGEAFGGVVGGFVKQAASDDFFGAVVVGLGGGAGELVVAVEAGHVEGVSEFVKDSFIAHKEAQGRLGGVGGEGGLAGEGVVVPEAGKIHRIEGFHGYSACVGDEEYGSRDASQADTRRGRLRAYEDPRG